MNLSRCVRPGSLANADKLARAHRGARLRKHIARKRDHLAAIELDAAHDFFMGQHPGAVLHMKTRNAERLGSRGNPARYRFRRADIKRTTFNFVVELRPRHRRPPAFGADPVAHLFVIRPQLLTRFIVGLGDIAVRMHTDLARRFAELRVGAVIEIDVRAKAIWIAADDGQHQWQIVMRRANNGFWTATDANPRLEGVTFSRRIYALISEGRACQPSPRDWLVLQDRGKQIEFVIAAFRNSIS